MKQDQEYTNKPTKYFSYQRNEMLEFIPNDAKKFLEVGCGGGDFGALLKDTRQVEVTGLEMVPEAAEAAKLKLDKVIVGNVEAEEIDIPNGYFDCLIFNDVLEHFRDPWAMLAKFTHALRPGGYVVASIPNMRYFPVFRELFLEGDWAYQDQGVLDRTHLRFFTFKTGGELFSQNGFKVLRQEGIHPQELPWKFGLLNTLLGGKFDEMKYMQFAIVAQLV